ncbi:MAG: molybdopterin-guanine dinucleotide biosynthesis protein B [Desulfobacterales bacterium]|jgi:molybdopterin-guanine dinucleotide biosynthesis protein MobB|nr:molybdopterin-guanine dinucleotide biosynthesis protein B [Desulfobacterales bacterium]
MPPIVSIVGQSESGKTTLIEKLIPLLTQRGYRIGTIKHTHHAVDIDRSGKDSARHRTAGAETVMLASPGRIAMFKATASESLDGLIRYFDDVDLLITEGYKRENKPKIEVLRAAVGSELLCRDDPGLVAVATDADLDVHVPVFRLDDPVAIAEFIEQRFLASRR